MSNLQERNPAVVPVPTLLRCETGSPDPLLIQTEGDAYLTFSLYEERERGAIRFKRCQSAKFGYPNNEALSGHPLYRFGLILYDLQLVRNSPWLEEIKKMNRVHRSHDDSLHPHLNHYVFPLHDSTFECIAASHDELKIPEHMDLSIANLEAQFAILGR